MMAYDVLIVGTGHAAAQAAISLRQGKFAGSIGMIGDEPDLPYERPPLSKEYLSGSKPFERLLIRADTFWSERNVTVILRERVVTVLPSTQQIMTASGRSFGYRQLIWAAGTTPRRVDCEGKDLAGVHSMRTRSDVDRMMLELPDVSDVVVIGGGFIGLEAAAVLSKLGKNVVLLEAMNRVLARVAGEPLSRFFEHEHRAHGVDIRLGVIVDHIKGNDRVTGVRLADGNLLPAQMVIVGIGVTPNVQPLVDAGAEGGNGVVVDEMCRSSLHDVFAIGDCALHANAYADGARIRLESVQNANDQAQLVARAILGENDLSYQAVPWFWSNQYDLRLQTIGLSTGFDETVVRGDPMTRSFSVIYKRKGRVIALDCVNMTRDYVQGRALVTSRSTFDTESLKDATLTLKSLVSAKRISDELVSDRAS